MKRSVLFCGVLALGAFLGTDVAAEARDSGKVLARLSASVPGLLAAKKIPSVSVARIEQGNIVFAEAWGEQSPGVRATAASLYNVASLTKPVSAEVILRLAARKQLSLDEPMFPHWVDPDLAADERHRLLTPRIALSHRTGFPNWRWETGDVLVFRRAPGEGYGYSGEGYEYVARFAEKKLKRGFEELAQSLVFAPAGMKDTAYTRRSWFAGRIAVATDADGKVLDLEPNERYVASDDMHTTAHDYARFMLSLINREQLGQSIAQDRERVQISRLGEMCPAPRNAACPRDVGPGLGWEVYDFGARRYLFHTGADRGVFTLAYLSPTNRTGTVILTNGASGAQVMLPILDALVDGPVDAANSDREFIDFLRVLAGQ